MRFMWVLLAVGCSDGKDSPDVAAPAGDSGSPQTDTGAEPDTGSEEPPVPTDATARLLDPMTGRGVEGLSVTSTFDGSSCETDSAGRCTVPVAQDAAFSLDVTGDAILPHRLQGESDDASFETISFVANATLTDQIYGMVGVSRDPDRGTVVVGLDNPDLSPAYGASAAIDGSAEVTFVLGAGRPIEGDTLVDDGFSIVTFVNVDPGTTTVTATGAEGTTCQAAPAERAASFEVEVAAGVISVVSFICR